MQLTPPELPDHPSKDEICAAIKALQNNKAVGLDGIPAELLQAAPMTSSELLQPLIETACGSECFPDEWKKGMIVKLPKKGDLMKKIGGVFAFCLQSPK